MEESARQGRMSIGTATIIYLCVLIIVTFGYGFVAKGLMLMRLGQQIGHINEVASEIVSDYNDQQFESAALNYWHMKREMERYGWSRESFRVMLLNKIRTGLSHTDGNPVVPHDLREEQDTVIYGLCSTRVFRTKGENREEEFGRMLESIRAVIPPMGGKVSHSHILDELLNEYGLSVGEHKQMLELIQ